MMPPLMIFGTCPDEAVDRIVDSVFVHVVVDDLFGVEVRTFVDRHVYADGRSSDSIVDTPI